MEVGDGVGADGGICGAGGMGGEEVEDFDVGERGGLGVEYLHVLCK